MFEAKQVFLLGFWIGDEAQATNFRDMVRRHRWQLHGYGARKTDDEIAPQKRYRDIFAAKITVGRSLTAGSSTLYLFWYSTFYFSTKAVDYKGGFRHILNFGCMLLGKYAFFVLTGTIGFYACLWFVRKIYSAVKID
ncbi:hypothetical protein RHMOL_Rhmol05G0020500 [Rhododendron molle]|uniref:Uncharacterized protein n=1 Tax=Rhododendron molle TaxID=49168 RepID=A0ACC0NKE8_RHOML|nr:hypothetical protein RHMOL_Rhmol05G0020500 [Rhododendron molle]